MSPLLLTTAILVAKGRIKIVFRFTLNPTSLLPRLKQHYSKQASVWVVGVGLDELQRHPEIVLKAEIVLHSCKWF